MWQTGLSVVLVLVLPFRHRNPLVQTTLSPACGWTWPCSLPGVADMTYVTCQSAISHNVNGRNFTYAHHRYVAQSSSANLRVSSLCAEAYTVGMTMYFYRQFFYCEIHVGHMRMDRSHMGCCTDGGVQHLAQCNWQPQPRPTAIQSRAKYGRTAKT